MGKKYCSKCVFLSDESTISVGQRYHDIRFRNDPEKRIVNNIEICKANVEFKWVVSDSPISQTKKLLITVDNPYIFNANNDCVMYKEPFLTRVLKKGFSCLK